MPRKWCRTIAEALDGVACFEELKGLVGAIKNPDIKTKPVTEDDKAKINKMHVQFLKERK